MRRIIIVLLFIITINLFSEIYQNGFVYETHQNSYGHDEITTRSYLHYIWNYYGGEKPEIGKNGYFPKNLEQLEAYIAESDENIIRIVYFPEDSIFCKYAINTSPFLDPFKIRDIGKTYGYRDKIRTRTGFYGHFTDLEDLEKFLKEYFLTDFNKGLPFNPFIKVGILIFEKIED